MKTSITENSTLKKKKQKTNKRNTETNYFTVLQAGRQNQCISRESSILCRGSRGEAILTCSSFRTFLVGVSHNDTCCWFSKPTWMNYTPPSPYAGQSLLRSLPSTGALCGTDVLPRLGLHTHPQKPTLTDVPRLSLVLQSGLISLPPLLPFAISNMSRMSLSDPLTSSLSLLPLKSPV